MDKTLKAIFRSNITLIVALVMMILCWLVTNYWYIFIRQKIYPLTLGVQILSVVYGCVVFYTFKSHDKNIMKPALGMLMGVLSMYALTNLFQNLLDPNIHVDYFTRGARGYASFTLDIIQCVLFFVFSMVHLQMNKTHESSPKVVLLNRLIILSLIVIFLAQLVLCYYRYTYFKAVAFSLLHVGLICMTIVVCCIESQVDHWRALRQGLDDD